MDGWKWRFRFWELRNYQLIDICKNVSKKTKRNGRGLSKMENAKFTQVRSWNFIAKLAKFSFVKIVFWKITSKMVENTPFLEKKRAFGARLLVFRRNGAPSVRFNCSIWPFSISTFLSCISYLLFSIFLNSQCPFAFLLFYSFVYHLPSLFFHSYQILSENTPFHYKFFGIKFRTWYIRVSHPIYLGTKLLG